MRMDRRAAANQLDREASPQGELLRGWVEDSELDRLECLAALGRRNV